MYILLSLGCAQVTSMIDQDIDTIVSADGPSARVISLSPTNGFSSQRLEAKIRWRRNAKEGLKVDFDTNFARQNSSS